MRPRTATVTFDADLRTPGVRENLEVRVNGTLYKRVDKNPVGRQYTLNGTVITLGKPTRKPKARK